MTAPVSKGSVNTRIALSAAENTCSGLCTRSKNLESGLKASLTDKEASLGISNCCNTGSETLVAKVSEGKSKTGRRLIVASAAPVNIFEAPGPTEAVHAKVDLRRCIRE